MKPWKHKTRRGLASLLALAMCLGLLQITVFAANMDTSAEDSGSAESSAPPTDTHETTTVTETEPAEGTDIPPVPEEGEEDTGGQPDDSETAAVSDYDAPLIIDKPIELEDQDTAPDKFFGSDSAVDWKKVQERLKTYGLEEDELKGFEPSNWRQRARSGTEITVENGKITITQPIGNGIVKTTIIDLSSTNVSVSGEFTNNPDSDTTDYGLVFGDSENPAPEAYTEEPVNTPEMNAIAAYGYWGAGDGDTDVEYGDGQTVSTADAKAATKAALFEGEMVENLSDGAAAFYAYLQEKIQEEKASGSVTEPAGNVPVITNAKVTLMAEDGSGTYTAEIVFAVTKSDAGELRVTILAEDGTETSVLIGNDPVTGNCLSPDENGNYTVMIPNVKLGEGAKEGNLMITTGETVTERTVYMATTYVPGPEPVLNKYEEELQESGEWDIYVDYRDEYHTIYVVDLSYNTAKEEYKYRKDSMSKGITITPSGNCAAVAAPDDKDVEVRYIFVERGQEGKGVIYEVPDGILHAGQTITVESFGNGDPEEAGFYVYLLGIGEERDPTPVTSGSYETYYGMRETTIEQNALLALKFLLGNATIQEETWSGGTEPPAPPPPGPSDRPARPNPRPSTPDPVPPPEVEVPDEDVPLEVLPPTEPPEENPPEPPEPVEIPEDDVPRVEIPDVKVPLAAAPKEKKPAAVTVKDTKVPLADVPKTGDSTGFSAAALALSVCGLAVLTGKKREDDTV